MGRKFLSLVFLAGLLAAGVPGNDDPSQPARAMLGGGKIAHLGLVVKDIEKSARDYVAILGVAVPAWELTDPVEKAHTIYLGRPTPAQAKLAFIELPNITLELIEPVGGPSTWRDFLEKKGEGVHHIAFEVKDLDARLAELEAKGVSLIQRGDYTGGRYAYVDATARLGLIVELLENY
jgi:methylmalonyl-CoA/ethylmalonyl-CoA epimerase